MADRARVRIFIDFWNFQLGWNRLHESLPGYTSKIQLPWKDLPLVITAEASKGQPAKFAGAHVYASVNKSSSKEKGLSSWLHHTLGSYPGYAVDVRERKPRSRAIRCQEENCHASITECPECKAPLQGAGEKGVDAAIITDLLTLAFDDNYDIAVLISGDADHAPAVRYIQKKTDKQVVQAFFKDHGDELRNACWDHIFFDTILGKFSLSPVQPPAPSGP